ncbi:MAG: hypothetical protein RJA19_328 [Bacteroidota bacterium]
MRKTPHARDKFINRELSWLTFNHRVLQEAASERVPLIERMRFLGIFSNNLDEFFRVRVANLQRAALVGKHPTTTLGFDVRETLARVAQRVVALQTENNRIFQELIGLLEQEGIHFLREDELDAEQQAFARRHFIERIRPSLVPIMVGGGVPFPDLIDGTLYLAVGLDLEDADGLHTRYAVIEVPTHLPRFIVLPSRGEEQYVMFIEDVIRLELRRIFALFNPVGLRAHAIKVTRDAEIDVDDDLTRSLMEKLARGVAKRKQGDYVRFLYDAEMPREMISYIKRKLKLGDTENVIPGSRYHNRKDLMGFPDFGRKDLIFVPQPPVLHPDFAGRTSLLAAIRDRDILLHLPYHDFSQIVDILREAAIDPGVTHIRINLYRVASQSQIINALVNAARNGKHVQVVIELAARFDERHNIQVSKVLQEAGAHVEFGVAGLKVHAKLFLITRKRGRTLEQFAHIGTGNFHERNGRIYTDHALLTSDPALTAEVERLFSFFSHNYERPLFRHLIVSPHSSRRQFNQMIDREIQLAQTGQEGWMHLKINNLVDAAMIEKLYDASRAGVRIQLLVRGICSLIPGVPGMSEHIEVRSLVGRYLEHGRVLIFGNNGAPLYYLSSSDWMTRNLDRRVEVTVPVREERLKKELMEQFMLQWNDPYQTRIIDATCDNRRIPQRDGLPAEDAQTRIYQRVVAQLNPHFPA